MERGRPVVFKQGYYMNREPGSVHGIDPSVPIRVGFLMLEWRTGPGTYLQEPNIERETTILPASLEVDDAPLKPDDAPPWVVVDSGGLTLIDTWEMPWQDFGGMQNSKQKQLSFEPGGWCSVAISYLGPRPTGSPPKRHYHATVHERGLCIGGELHMREFDGVEDDVGQRVRFREGVFMDRRPGCVHGVDTTRSSGTGFTFLEWRTGPSTYLLEEGTEKETKVLPAAELPD
jgi:hypothetical protein